MNSYYGSYRTRTFSDIFPNLDEFWIKYNEVLIPQKINEDSVTTLYYLLYAKYGNSHIASSDENQFLYALFSTIFMYGPTWEKRLDIQDKLRALSEEDIVRGSKAIHNHAYNPGTAPSTDTLDELLAINDQNTTQYKKSKLEAYALLMSIIQTDVTADFISKFKNLFIVVLAPDYPLLYETEGEN
jgi:hypothetical protein